MDLEKAKSSKNFCILPWIHQHVMPDSTVLPCCVAPYDEPFGDLKKQSIYEIWNSEKYLNLRKSMMEDRPSSTCTRCYEIEKNGFESLRQSAWIRFNKFFELVQPTSPTGHLAELHSKYIDLRFSNLCNLKCMGCSPALSSSWFDDHQKLFEYKSEKARVLNVAEDAPEFWKQFKFLLKDCEEIYFGGGEPLITKEHFEILQLLILEGKTDVKLSYNTNLSTLTYGRWNLGDLWAKFARVLLGISLDDIEGRAEYFRSGTKWNLILENLKILKEKHPHVERYVNCTISSLNVFYLPELFTFLMEEKIIDPYGFKFNLLLDPHDLSVQALPPLTKIKVTKRLNFFRKQTLIFNPQYKAVSEGLQNIIQFMNEHDSYLEQGAAFRNRIRTLDEIRKTDFKTTYPEISEVLDD